MCQVQAGAYVSLLLHENGGEGGATHENIGFPVKTSYVGPGEEPPPTKKLPAGKYSVEILRIY